MKTKLKMKSLDLFIFCVLLIVVLGISPALAQMGQGGNINGMGQGMGPGTGQGGNISGMGQGMGPGTGQGMMNGYGFDQYDSRFSGFGSMTFGEVCNNFGVPVETALSDLNLPENMDKNLTVLEVEEQYGVSGQEIASYVPRTCSKCLLLLIPGSDFLCASRPHRTCEVWVRECISCVRVALHTETIRPSVLILIQAKSATLQLVGTRFSMQ